MIKKFIVTKQQLINIFEQGFGCSAEGFNAEYGLKYDEKTNKTISLLKHGISLNDYEHEHSGKYMDVFENLILKFEVKQ